MSNTTGDNTLKRQKKKSRAWFHPTIDGTEAEELLKKEGGEGFFLVRPSHSSPGNYALSVMQGGEIFHIHIENLGDVYRIVGGEKFASLSQLVDYYTESKKQLYNSRNQPMPLKNWVVCKRPTYEPWFHPGPLSSEEAVALLMKRGETGSFLVRASQTKPGDYVLSVRYGSQVAHTLVHSEGEKFRSGPEKVFESLASLVEDVKNNPMVDPFSGETLYLHEMRAKYQVKELPKLVESMCAGDTIDGFCREFEGLQQVMDKDTVTHDMGERQENVKKNRQRTVLPYDHNRVILNGTSGGCFAKASDYINASFIEGDISAKERMYIATQAPPAKDTAHDFWQMIWESDSYVVVMILKEVEAGEQKSFVYWPASGKKCAFGAFVIRCDDEQVSPTFIKRTLNVHYKGQSRTIFHLQFLAWPENGIISPANCPNMHNLLLEFVKAVKDTSQSVKQKNSKVGPCVIHCSYGVGRTGTFILADMLYDMITARGHECELDIPTMVQRIRAQRAGMIQTPDQYRILYFFALSVAGFNDVISFDGRIAPNKKIAYEAVKFGPSNPEDGAPPPASFALGPAAGAGAAAAAAAAAGAPHRAPIPTPYAAIRPM